MKNTKALTICSKVKPLDKVDTLTLFNGFLVLGTQLDQFNLIFLIFRRVTQGSTCAAFLVTC